MEAADPSPSLSRRSSSGSLALLTLALLGVRADGHAMMSFPRPRNALDARLAPWNGSVPAFPLPFDHPNWCALPDAASSDPRKISGGGGQACFWVGTPPPRS